MLRHYSLATGLLILGLLLVAGCQGGGPEEASIEDVTLTTQDGLEIKGTFYEGQEGAPGVVLLHMLGRDRTDWDTFARTLTGWGFSALAIDLRGHGESSGDLSRFSARDFNNMVLDARAGKVYLKERGVTKIGFIGASIGANTALNYAAQDPSVRCVVLLSPGLDYKGIQTSGSAASYGDRPIFIVASEEDEYSAESALALYNEAGDGKAMQLLSGAGHGTRMFNDPRLQPMILNWLRDDGFK